MFRAARAVLLSMRASEDFGCAERLSAAEQIKPDCCRTPAVVSILLTPLPVSCPSTTPHHYSYIEPCFGIGHSLSLICQLTSEDIKHHSLEIVIQQVHLERNCLAGV